MSLDGTTRARTLYSAALLVIITVSGWTLKTTIDHSTGLAGISQQIADLKLSIDSSNVQINTEIGTLSHDDQVNTAAIAAHNQAIDDLERELAERPLPQEHHAMLVPPPPPIPIIPQIAPAISRLLGIRARGTRGRNASHMGR